MFLIAEHLSVCMCACMNVCMNMWVTHHYSAPWALSSDAHLSASPLHAEPSEPSAVYTLPLLLLALSLFISLTHSHAHLFALRRSLPFSPHLPPAPYSTSLILTHSASLVFFIFSLAAVPPSLFITAPLCVYLCRCRRIQTETVSNSIRFRQTLRVPVSLLVCGCMARTHREQVKRIERDAFQTFKHYTWHEADDGITIEISS